MARTLSLTGWRNQPYQTIDLFGVKEDVLYRAPGKNETEIRKAIREAARDFLSRTNVWKESRECGLIDGGWYAFQHGYRDAEVVRVDAFGEDIPQRQMRGEFTGYNTGVADIVGGIPPPLVGNPTAPSIPQFVEQGGYVLIKGPGSAMLPDFGESDIPSPIQDHQCPVDSLKVTNVHSHHKVGMAVFTLTLTYGGELLPEWIVKRYASVIADGAAHHLATGPQIVQTSYGQRFTNSCDEIAMRMANGGVSAPLDATTVTHTLRI